MTMGPDPTMRIDCRSVRLGNSAPPFIETALHGRRVQLAALCRREQTHGEGESVHPFERRDERAKLLRLTQRLPALLFGSDARFRGKFLLHREGVLELLLQRSARLLRKGCVGTSSLRSCLFRGLDIAQRPQ